MIRAHSALPRRFPAFVVLLLAALVGCPPCPSRAAPPPALPVRVDAVSYQEPTDPASEDKPLPALVARWARLDTGRPLAAAAPPSLRARAARFPGGVAVVVTNPGSEAQPVRVEIRVPRGLWRADAAFIAPEPQPESLAIRAWRMESSLRPQPGMIAKPVSIPPGHTLALRLIETVAAAQAAYRSAAALKQGQSDFLQNRLGRALSPVGNVVTTLDGWVAKSDRSQIAQKTHRALLAAAQAQAVWENAQGASLSSRDAVFDDLVAALSEVSLAAYNLVPRQTESVAGDGTRTVRVSLKNAGTRTVPYVTLGVQGPEPGAKPSSARRVFKAVAPGEQVAASFGAAGERVLGIVQFILGMGAAVVPATPQP